MLVKSDLFRYYSERMIGMIMTGAENSTNPHTLYVLFNILLLYGHKHHSLFRSHRKWRKLLASLCDTIIVECEDAYSGTSLLQPIEARLRLPAALLMYEVCRVQKLTTDELEGFDDMFIDRLFEMVEITRDTDEVLNYAIVRNSHPPLSDAMSSYSSAALASQRETAEKEAVEREEQGKRDNRVLSILMRRLGHSKTFGENIIFMLNRSQDNAEDLCVQLLILKILYLLFTTPGTQEYFFTNDLQVLVDVFIRELVDLPDESEALRHTYLRVLNPLLTNTQLRQNPYKHAQIRLVLLSLISNSHIKDINPTTRRLVERCLQADWGKAKEKPTANENGVEQTIKAGSGVSINISDENGTPVVNRKDFTPRTLGRSQSAEDMPKLHKAHVQHLKIDTKHPNLSLTDVAAALPPTSRKHARSVTSETASERDRGKKRSLQQHAVLQNSESMTDSSYELSESGRSDDGSPGGCNFNDAKMASSTTSSSSVAMSVAGSGHSPVERWMQFTSPESMTSSYPSLACGFINTNAESNPAHRHTGLYEADSIVGVRDQRVNARLFDTYSTKPFTLLGVGGIRAPKRKPPPVPARSHKPGNISSVSSTARNSANQSPSLTPWSSEFASRTDVANPDEGYGSQDTEVSKDADTCQENNRTMGFAALAQALRETGIKTRAGPSDSSGRRNSTKKRKPQSRGYAGEEGIVSGQHQNEDISAVLNVEQPVVVRKWDEQDQSHGWTTFA
ncbi:hypothetical protein QFC19_001789 [Naganishia cerealis]|uniref:Uncharacterized protein n=1 Tax=Naganishia cerealis TaxID=610337 RepID=A0ACC2WFD4_9TREE|nr:hypothetical protein QFC19_001789 [Naganishia cerealis]